VPESSLRNALLNALRDTRMIGPRIFRCCDIRVTLAYLSSLFNLPISSIRETAVQLRVKDTRRSYKRRKNVEEWKVETFVRRQFVRYLPRVDMPVRPVNNDITDDIVFSYARRLKDL